MWVLPPCFHAKNQPQYAPQDSHRRKAFPVPPVREDVQDTRSVAQSKYHKSNRWSLWESMFVFTLDIRCNPTDQQCHFSWICNKDLWPNLFDDISLLWVSSAFTNVLLCPTVSEEWLLLREQSWTGPGMIHDNIVQIHKLSNHWLCLSAIASSLLQVLQWALGRAECSYRESLFYTLEAEQSAVLWSQFLVIELVRDWLLQHGGEYLHWKWLHPYSICRKTNKQCQYARVDAVDNDISGIQNEWENGLEKHSLVFKQRAKSQPKCCIFTLNRSRGWGFPNIVSLGSKSNKQRGYETCVWTKMSKFTFKPSLLHLS